MALFNIPKTERELKYGQLAYTKAPEIMNKYELLIEEMKNKNDLKHIKITGDKLEWLYNLEGVSAVTLKYELDILKYLPEQFFQLNYYMYYYSLNFKYQIDNGLIEILQSLAEKIHQMFYDIFNKKIYNPKGVYFSTIEHIVIAEILEILDEYYNKIIKIINKLENFCDDYCFEEIDDFCDMYGIDNYYYNPFFYYDLKNELEWIFNKNIPDRYCYMYS